ncbi:MAG: helicase, partial [Bacteroidetes bacterium]|nr:helicase [Bacteroidota bacterium]
KIEDAERIKNLSTTKSIKSEAKGKDKVEVPFYGKFVLCSNNESGFIKIAPNEIRFWIRKIPRFEKEIPDFIERMKPEIPGFLHALLTRSIAHPKTTRMWFEPENLHTEAVDKVKKGTMPRIEKEIKELITMVFLLVPEINEVHFTPTDISNEIRTNSGRFYAMTEIKEVLQKWGLKRESKMKYTKYSKIESISTGEEGICHSKHTGTPYLIERNNFCTDHDF